MTSRPATELLSGFSRNVLAMPRSLKRLVALGVDVFLCVASVATAYLLRLDRVGIPVGFQYLSYIGAIIIALPLFVSFGFYRAIFRYAGWGVFIAMIRACGIYALVYSFVFTVVGVAGVPRTVGVIQPILLFLFVSASRAVARFWLAGEYRLLLKLGQKRRVLIYGAGSSGRQLAAGLANSTDMHVVGFVDDDPRFFNNSLNGKPVYSGDGLGNLIDELKISDLLLAIPSASRQRRNDIIATAMGTSANIQTLPSILDLAHGRVTINDLRELEIEDLLARPAVVPDTTLLTKNITDKVVMISGAGGSIGGELSRQVLMEKPSVLLLVDMSEFNLYSVHQELLTQAKLNDYSIETIPLLASVQDRSRMDMILSSWKPHTIYHAAAYKHVPLVEHNLAEGVRNNVFGTLILAEMAQKHRVESFVLVSTDKAVRPTNVMGATKRLAELSLQGMAAERKGTCFSIVRFGNVLDSSGSVVPLFRQQIKSGGPITLTHPEVTRYFMTIPEAAQLVIQAGAMAEGGEVFVLDMGDPVKIIDLAHRMVELSGLHVKSVDNPNGDIEISIVGLRPGEKLYEELLIGDNAETTSHPRILKANESYLDMPTLRLHLEKFEMLIRCNAADEIRAELRTLVQGYSAADDTVDWLHARTIAK